MKSYFRKYLLSFAFSIINSELIEKVPFEPLQDYIRELLHPLEEITNAVTDKNPNDRQQLAEIWEKWDEPTLDKTLEMAAKIVEQKISDPVRAKQFAYVLRKIAAENILDRGEDEEIKPLTWEQIDPSKEVEA